MIASTYSDGTSDAADWICPGPTWRCDRDGIVVSNHYNAAKLLASSVRYSPFGAVTTTYTHDGEGRVIREETSAADCETKTVTRTYDSRGRIASETDELGASTSYAYSADDLVTTVTYADGGTKITTLYTDGSVRSVTGTAVTPEYYTYGVTSEGLKWTQIRYGRADSPRFKTTYVNGFDEIVREERSGANGSVLATDYYYDDFGAHVATCADGEPDKEYAYDELGDLVATTLAAEGAYRYVSNTTAYVVNDGAVWRRRITESGCSDATIVPQVTESGVRASGLSLGVYAESYSVDVRGNTNFVWSVYNPAAVERIDYRSQAGVANVAETVSVDGKVVESVSFSAVTNRVEYDALRRTVADIDGRGNRSEREYFAAGRLIADTDALTNTTWTAYDAMGRIIAVTNALGEVTRYEYDVRGNKVYEGGATYPVRYTYDVYGNKVTMMTYRDESQGVDSGDVTTWRYDESSGVMTNKVYADGNGLKYEYDDYGRLAKRIWARGVETFYAYDGWGNLTNTSYSDSTPTVTVTYDALGRQIEAHDASGVTTFEYDTYGANTNESVAGVTGSNVIERFFDEYGRDAGYALNGVRRTTIGYDAATGRIATMLAAGSSEPFRWTYLDGSDLKASLEYPNGLTATWEYDANNNLAQVRNATTANVISQYDYTYDDARRRIGCGKSGTVFSQNDSIGYSYNERGELTNAVAAVDSAYRYAYDYDDIGNRTTATERGTNSVYSANCLNQYSAVDDFTPQFDADGNQTLVKTSTGVWYVTYNGENRPILWSNDTTIVAMSYDRKGRRVTKNNLRFIYNGYLQIADSTVNSYIWDPTELVATRPLVWNSSNSVAYYTHDGNKNVSEVIRESGSVAAHYAYAPFGAVVLQNGDLSFDNPWRFSSEYADAELDCAYYNYRHYNSYLGLWTSRDPLFTKAGANVYSYCMNVVLKFDYLGMESCNSCVSETSGFPSPDDFYGRYCGAKRINGRVYPEGQLGLSPDEIGTVSEKDEFDKCCKIHDQCLSRIQNSCWRNCAEKNLAIKNCDMRISLCWSAAQITHKETSILTRLKITVAVPVMPLFAHPTAIFPIEKSDGSVDVGFIGLQF